MKYPINGETGLPTLPEGYRWFISRDGHEFNMEIQKEHDTEDKFIYLPRTLWEKFVGAAHGKSEHRKVTLIGEDRWKTHIYYPMLKESAFDRIPDMDEDDGHYVSDYVKILTPEIILRNARNLVALFDENLRAKESKKYLGAYPPGKINQ